MLTTVIQFSIENLELGYSISYVPHTFLVTLTFQLCMYYANLYDLNSSVSNNKLFIKILQAFAGTTLVLAALFYLLPQVTVSRGIILSGLAVAFLFVVGWRLFYQYLHGMAHFRVKVLIIGTGVEAKKLTRELLHNKSLGYEVKGFIDEDPAKLGMSIVNPKVIGTLDQLPAIVEHEGIDKVVVALPDRRGKLPLGALLACKLRGVDVEEETTFYEKISGKVLLENLRPSWIIFSRGFAITPLLGGLKRLADILLVSISLPLTALLMPVIAMLIKLDSRGSVFFTQQRVGQNGKLFTLVKFRSMRADAEVDTGPVFAGENDSRITRVGKLLRKTHLDELPQLLNVLRGDMSFVGPRPERPFFVDQLEKEIPYYTQRLSVKPGITGWAQVNYHYASTTEDAIEKLQLELYYIKNMSLLLDLFIILKTVKIAVLGTGAQ